MNTATEIRRKGKHLDPAIRIGKNGLTDSVIGQINKMLEKKQLIKVKFLKSAMQDKNKKEFAKELAEKTGSILIESIGFVAVIYKKV